MPKRCCSCSSCRTGSWRWRRVTWGSPLPRPTISKRGPQASARGSRCRAPRPSPIFSRGGQGSGFAPPRGGRRSSSSRGTPRASRYRARSRRCSKRIRPPTAVSGCHRRSFPTWAPNGSPLRQVRKGALYRSGPAILVGLAFAFGALSVGSAWVVARHLRDDARETSRMFGRVFCGLNDPRPDAATGTLFDLAAQVRALGIPLAITDSTGRVTALENAPAGLGRDRAALPAWVAELDAVNPPISGPGIGTVHFGALPVTRRLERLAALQGGVLLALVGLAIWAYRIRLGAVRDRLWVAMARESAHQL